MLRDFPRREFVIRGGIVVDGTGVPPRRGDVAIGDGRIVEIGEIPMDGRESLDAEGCWVTPGFIDPHTHLDAQLCWDPSASPTNRHGVTSVVLGLCGFGVAPCPKDGSEYLLRSLERVEEIPYESTRLGVPFGWTEWSEYWSFIRDQPLGVNVAGFVPHSALRYFVMGDRARGEVATADDRAAMVAELKRAIDAGALGFATSRGPNHEDGFGNPVPSRFADDAEFEALVAACTDHIWHINVETKFSNDADALIAELDRYIGWTRSAKAALTWSPLHAEPGTNMWREVLDHNEATNAAGTVVAPQVAPLPLSLMLRFDESTIVFQLLGLGRPLRGFFDRVDTERLRLLGDTDVRAALRETRPHPKMPIAIDLRNCTFLSTPSRPDWDGKSLGELATALGKSASDVMCDQVIADGLATLIDVPIANQSLEGALRFIEDPNTLLALGDSGAHVTSTTQYRYPTFMLAELVQERGLLSVELAVNRMTQRPARLLGLRDRGELREGAVADVCVIDRELLGLDPVSIRHDLPGGSPRLFHPGRGYRSVLVGGVATVSEDEPTGAAPGTTLAPAI